MTEKNKDLVARFLREVRSGVNPSSAGEFMAPLVKANQVVSEDNEVVFRSPDDYSQHVLAMKEEYGDFRFSIDELLSDGDKVYARWTQIGRGIREVASCVYRIQDDRIAEYWIQIDRLGLQIQKDRS